MAAEAAPRGRANRLRSIGIRIVLPVLLAAVVLVALGLVQTRDAIAEASAAERAATLARLSSSAVALVHHIELEYSETNALRQRGGAAGAQLLTAARARTDAARLRFGAAADDTRRSMPRLRPAVDNATRALDLLQAARNLAPGSPDGSIELFDVYNQMSGQLLAVADAVPAQLNDPQLVELARSVSLVAELEHVAAAQLDLLRRVFNRQRLEGGELVQLARWAGGEQQRREELQRLTGPVQEQLRELANGIDVERAARLRNAVLNSDGARGALRADPDVWYVAQSGLLRRLRIIAVELSTAMETKAYRIQTVADVTSIATGVLTALVVTGTLAGAVVMAVQTSRRLRRMRRAALDLAQAELPATVAQVTAATDPGSVQDALKASSARIDAAMAAGTDEIGELGLAFSTVHRQALRLAADQALLRMEVEAIFVALSRRGQTLAQRQLHLIDEFGRVETDPHRLTRLYALDQLAGRLRRNEENLLVLAGGEPGRRITAPAPVYDAIAASIEEVEERSRIEVTGAPAVAIAAHAVGDVIHLLAELMENAANFSPPSAKVRVAARRTVESVAITVFDDGIGMPPEKLAEANRRLAEPSTLTSTLVGTMGLLVVGRLAHRHGMRVQLSSTPGGGTAATVVLPETILAPTIAADHLRRGRWRGEAEEAIDTPARGRPYLEMGWSSGSAAPADSAASRWAPGGSGPSPAPEVRAVPIQPGEDRRPVPSPGGFTAAGLPRRVAAVEHDRPVAAPAGAAGRPRTAGPPDPEATRARLSSLATGIAAAGRKTAPADPPQPS